jgi:hypothetical protein
MEIPIPYGQQEVLVRVPDENVLGVVHPNEVSTTPEEETLLEALDHPTESPPFSEFLDDARDVLFVVNDGTRPTPTAKVLEILHEQIRGVDATGPPRRKKSGPSSAICTGNFGIGFTFMTPASSPKWFTWGLPEMALRCM